MTAPVPRPGPDVAGRLAEALCKSPAVPGGGQRDGACFDVFDGIGGHRLFCILRAGHVGSHESEDGARWALAAPAAGADPAAGGGDPAEIVRQRTLGWPDMHPEDFCHRCGRPNPCWFADTAEWQTATGSTGDGGGILCPSCFCALWEQVTGRTAIIWRLSIDPRSRDAAPADPAAGEAKLRDEVTREIAGWMAAPHEPEQWQIDNADDLAANLLTGPLAALVAERDQAQGAIAHIPWEDEHTPYRYRETGDAFCRVCAHGWPCPEAAGR